MKDSGLEKNSRLERAPYHYEGEVLVLRVHVQPNASRTEWGGMHGASALKLRVQAPPVEGKANRACLRYLAKAAGVSARSVTLVRGEQSRDKTIRIAPIDPAGFRALKQQWHLR